jgi:hypothetical protein
MPNPVRILTWHDDDSAFSSAWDNCGYSASRNPTR